MVVLAVGRRRYRLRYFVADRKRHIRCRGRDRHADSFHDPTPAVDSRRRAILSITQLGLAERICALRQPSSGYSCELSDLGEQGLVDSVLASGTKSGYHFEIRRLRVEAKTVRTSQSPVYP